ncbi:MAG: cysteine synthase, partial [Armatimonadota bacterium]|nr:cysteine synthase [Armatimonadota bacterium]
GRPITSTRHKIQGTGYAEVPPLWDPALCDGYLTATDEETIATARALAAQEGILGGFSTGANVAAALHLARQASPGEVVVTLAPDSGMKYLSTDLYP